MSELSTINNISFADFEEYKLWKTLGEPGPNNWLGDHDIYKYIDANRELFKKWE